MVVVHRGDSIWFEPTQKQVGEDGKLIMILLINETVLVS